MSHSRADATRSAWIATLNKFRHDPIDPRTIRNVVAALDSASRDELAAIQNEKLARRCRSSTRTARSIAGASTGSVLLPTTSAASTTSPNGRWSTRPR